MRSQQKENKTERSVADASSKSITITLLSSPTPHFTRRLEDLDSDDNVDNPKFKKHILLTGNYLCFNDIFSRLFH